MKADITGLMQKPQPGWEKRVEELCKIEHVDWTPHISFELDYALTEAELARFAPKIQMVREFARYMLIGMLKGTLKYNYDNYTIDQWMAHLIGEGADQANYAILLFNAWRNWRGESETK